MELLSLTTPSSTGKCLKEEKKHYKSQKNITGLFTLILEMFWQTYFKMYFIMDVVFLTLNRIA